MIQETEKRIAHVRELGQIEGELNMSGSVDLVTEPQFSEEQLELFKEGILNLTQTERLIYDLYVSGKSTKEVLGTLNIKENTLK